MASHDEQAAGKWPLGLGRRRVAAVAVLAMLAAAAGAAAGLWNGTHKPPAAAGSRPAPARHVSAAPEATAPAPVDVHVASCPVPAVDYAGTALRPQAAPTVVRLPASLASVQAATSAPCSPLHPG